MVVSSDRTAGEKSGSSSTLQHHLVGNGGEKRRFGRFCLFIGHMAYIFVCGLPRFGKNQTRLYPASRWLRKARINTVSVSDT